MKNKLKQTMTALCAALILMGGFSVPAYAQGTAAEPPTEDATNDSNVVVEEPETPPLTPKGNATPVSYTHLDVYKRQVVRNVVQTKFTRPKERPYRTENLYAVLEKQRKLEKEVSAIVKRTKMCIRDSP